MDQPIDAHQDTIKPLITRATSEGRTLRGQRSAVTNGRRLHVVRPGDTCWARRFRDVLVEILSDIGNEESLSEGQRQLARRCATIAIACEKMEGEAAAGNDIDLDAYGTLTDRLGRAFARLGLRKRHTVHDITPPRVEDYVKHINNKDAAT